MDLRSFFSGAPSAPAAPDLGTACFSLLFAFVLGQLVAWVYACTHSGVSYSRSFTQSLVVITMVVALVMLVIGDNIVTAFGLLGALAIVRFRNVLKDARDLVFVFACLVIGMAIGAQRHDMALVGALAVLAAVVHLRATSFGSRGRWDGHLTCWIEPDGDGLLSEVLRRFCARTRRISVRQGGGDSAAEYVFQIRLRDRRLHRDLVSELRAVPAVSDAALVLRDELSEL